MSLHEEAEAAFEDFRERIRLELGESRSGETLQAFDECIRAAQRAERFAILEIVNELSELVEASDSDVTLARATLADLAYRMGRREG